MVHKSRHYCYIFNLDGSLSQPSVSWYSNQVSCQFRGDSCKGLVAAGHDYWYLVVSVSSSWIEKVVDQSTLSTYMKLSSISNI